MSEESVSSRHRPTRVRKRLFIETSQNTSVQSNCRKKVRFQKSSSDEEEILKSAETSIVESSSDSSSDSSSSSDETVRSANKPFKPIEDKFSSPSGGSSYDDNSLLFNLKSSRKSNQSSETSSDEDDTSSRCSTSTVHSLKSDRLTSERFEDDLMDSASRASSVDYSIKDYDYTLFREELAQKVAEKSFAVSTENESSDYEGVTAMDISFNSSFVHDQNEEKSEEVCENEKTDCVEEIVNDIILSIILGIESEHNAIPAQNISEEIVKQIIDELIASIQMNISENSVDKIVEEILEDIISSLPIYAIPEEITASDFLRKSIEEIFGENTHEIVSRLQNIVYDVPEEENSEYLDYSVASESVHEIIDQMSISEDSLTDSRNSSRNSDRQSR